MQANENHAQRATGSALMGAGGTGLLAVTRPAGRLPALPHVLSWLQETPVDTVLITTTWVLGWAAVAWLTVIAFLAAASALPGGLGALSRSLLRLLAPRAVRRALELALGMSLAAGPIFGSAAMAAAPPAAPHNAVLSIPALDRPLGAIPSLDRPSLSAPQLSALPSLDRPVRSAPARWPVTVRPGDSLWLIAQHGLGHDASDAQIGAEWPRWYAANRSVIGDNPNLIQPGQHLEPPLH